MRHGIETGSRRSDRKPQLNNCASCEAGQSFVEIALMMPLFMLILVGAIELGWLGYYSAVVADAAHAGAIYGAQNSTTAADTANIATAAENDAVNLGKNALTVSSTFFCSCASAPTSSVSCSTDATECSSSHALTFVQVTASAAVPMLVHLPSLPSSYTMTSVATMRVE